ncbi:MAG: Asp-tRNA(Asn)/Glu-tRNA(Gln) amidotransferase subunit GatB, partial [bacterium]
TDYETVIGLEIHVQLKTKTKIFCSCSTAFGKEPNTNTCPVCLGLPGALPVLNKKAVELAMMLGLALDCTIQKEAIWDRKNYFYQDLPKGYQITQFSQPLCLNGHINIESCDTPKKVRINRIHMEEDAGKSIHDYSDKATCIDLNRAGTPLCEVVTEPDINSAQEAGAFVKAMRSIVRYTGAGDGNMEEGSLRCDANISIRPFGQKELGTKVELKNLNSIKFIEKAVAYEAKRQEAVLTDGGTIIQETRLYNEATGQTEPMRTKEDAHDYRYFPDPDLVPLIIDDQWINTCKKNLPELAKAKKERFIKEFKLSEYDANLLSTDRDMAVFFENTLTHYNEPKKVANWIMTELMRLLNDNNIDISASPVSPQNLATLLKLIDANTISGTIAKKVFSEMSTSGKNPETIIKEKNLSQVVDPEAIKKVIQEIITANPTQVEQFKQGKEKVFSFFVGQVMRAMQGKASPEMVNDLLKKELK